MHACIKSQIKAGSPLDLTVLDQHLIMLCYLILKHVLKTIWGNEGTTGREQKEKVQESC